MEREQEKAQEKDLTKRETEQQSEQNKKQAEQEEHEKEQEKEHYQHTIGTRWRVRSYPVHGGSFPSTPNSLAIRLAAPLEEIALEPS